MADTVNTMNKKRGVGIIGFGGMANWHYQNLLKSIRVELKGIFDIDPKRQKVAEDLGIHVYATQEELLADETIEIVTIATPNNFHKDIAIAAFAAGKHVFCEKPVAMSSEEVEDMTAAAQKYHRIFSVDQNRRVDRDFLVVKEAVQSGLLGDVQVIESRVHGSRGIPEGWRQYKIAGGGMLLDWGVHLLDQLCVMFEGKKVLSVYCQMIKDKFPEVDEYFKILLTFEGDVQATVEVGTNNFINLPRWYVCGKKGTLQLDDWHAAGKVVRAKETTVKWEEEIVYTKAGPTKTMAPRSQNTIEELTLEDPDDSGELLTLYNNICDVLEGGATLSVTPAQFLRVMKLMEACFRSFEENQVVKLAL